GLRVLVVDADGNCLFRALSDQLQGDEGGHARVRRDVLDHEEAEEALFRHFVEDDEDWEDYLGRLRRSQEWGGHQELVAASQVFKVHIVVHQLRAPRLELRCDDKAKRTLHLSFHGEEHYNSVRRQDDAGGAAPLSLPHLPPLPRPGGPSPFELVERACPWALAARIREALRCASDSVDGAVERLASSSRVVATDEDDDGAAAAFARQKRPQKPRRSASCPCASGKRYHKCCRDGDLEKGRADKSHAKRPPDSRGRPASADVLAADVGALQL
ncbi:hypothetical protein M885DRAFT_572743, partial [Pelagophyceae sp. CCMP2097]